MADLVSGRFPQTNPYHSTFFGGVANSAQSDVPISSNVEYLGYAGAADTAGALTTNTLTCVPIAVDYGVTYSAVLAIVGATAPTVTINYAAVYAGTAAGVGAALLGQSANAGATPPTASQVGTFTLVTPVTATAANAPNGYWYVGVQATGVTPFSLATVTVAIAVDKLNAAVLTTAPIAMGFTAAATTATAPAVLPAVTVVAAKPILALR
jgi:hypothetical protein